MTGKEFGAHPFHAFEHYQTQPCPGIDLRQHFAGLVDVSVYSPLATFELKFNRQPTVNELAEYIASIRVIESDAILAELAKDHP